MASCCGQPLRLVTKEMLVCGIAFVTLFVNGYVTLLVVQKLRPCTVPAFSRSAAFGINLNRINGSYTNGHPCIKLLTYCVAGHVAPRGKSSVSENWTTRFDTGGELSPLEFQTITGTKHGHDGGSSTGPSTCAMAIL